jgi:hypothetical protein
MNMNHCLKYFYVFFENLLYISLVMLELYLFHNHFSILNHECQFFECLTAVLALFKIDQSMIYLFNTYFDLAKH